MSSLAGRVDYDDDGGDDDDEHADKGCWLICGCARTSAGLATDIWPSRGAASFGGTASEIQSRGCARLRRRERRRKSHTHTHLCSSDNLAAFELILLLRVY